MKTKSKKVVLLEPGWTAVVGALDMDHSGSAWEINGVCKTVVAWGGVEQGHD